MRRLLRRTFDFAAALSVVTCVAAAFAAARASYFSSDRFYWTTRSTARADGAGLGPRAR